MEGLTSYAGNDWDLFTQDLLEYFDAERDIKRYMCSNLDTFCKKSRKHKGSMRMTLWKRYNREFIRIAGWLTSHRKLTADEQSLYFWKGILKDFREKLEARLLIIQPNHNLEQPFKIDNINRVAKSLLLRNRFDHFQRLDEDDSTDSESSDSASDESDSEDSDEDLPVISYPKKSKDKEWTKKLAVDEVPVKTKSTNRTASHKTQDKEVEELITQMNKLSVNDPSYSILYFRAYQLNPIITDLVPKPIERQAIANRLNLRTAPAPYQSSNQPSQESGNNSGFNRPPPPHFRTGGNAYRQLPPDERRCFGCGGTGHTMFFCEEINKLLKEGVVTKDNAGKIVMANGMYIRRISPEEPLTTAVERLRPVQSNYIAIHQTHSEEYLSSESDSSDSSDDDSDSDIAVYTMTRSGRKIVHPRKELEGVFLPARRKRDEERTTIKKPAKPTKEPAKKVEEVLPVPKFPTPIIVENTRFNPQNDDAFMEDDTQNLEGVQAKPESKVPEESSVIPWVKKAPRQSEVQSQVDQRNVLG